MQVTVNNTELDNGSWRRIVNQFKRQVQGEATLDVFECTFLIFGDTNEELQTRLNSTLSDFEGFSARVKATLNTAAANSLIDWYPGDGVHEDTVVNITSLPNDQDTGHRLVCYMAVGAPKNLTAVPGGSGASPGGVEFEGQVNRFTVSEEYSESGGVTIMVTGAFQPTIDEAAFGPFPLTTISDDSGSAKFTITGVPPAVPDYEEGQRINVSGTTNYNGIHIIKSITHLVTTSEIVTDAPFTLPETPASATLTIDDFIRGEENYQAARSTILTDYLQTASDGSRDPATKRVLARENLTAQDSSGTFVEFILTAREQDDELPTLELASGADITRGATINISLAPVERFNERFGGRFTEVRVEGKIPITVGSLSEKTLYEWWELVDPELRAIVSNKTGFGSLYLSSTRPVLDYLSNTIVFSALYLGDFDKVIGYKDTMGVKEISKYSAYSAKKGDILQRGPRDRSIVASFVAERIGLGRVEPRTLLRNPPNRRGGGVWIEDDFTYSESFDTDQDGQLIYTTNVEARWTLTYPFSNGAGKVIQKGNKITFTP